jgi:hypothetical protein
MERIQMQRELVDFGRWSRCTRSHRRFPWHPPNCTEMHKCANVWTYGFSTATTHTTMVGSYALRCCALRGDDVRGTLYEALQTSTKHPNTCEHVQTSTNMFEHLQTTMDLSIQFKSSACISYCLWNIIMCFIPYSDMCISFLDDPHQHGDHLFTCILTL